MTPLSPQCVMLSNQEHCVKNPKFLIAALIEHVFVQVPSSTDPNFQNFAESILGDTLCPKKVLECRVSKIGQ